MEWQSILTGLGALIGSGGIGAVILKLAQLWSVHSRAVDGDFTTRSTTVKDNFQIVVDNLQRQQDSLILRLRDLDTANANLVNQNIAMRNDYETRLRSMQSEIDELRRENAAINCHLHDREILVLLEDYTLDAMWVRGVLKELMRKTDLELTVVETLAKLKRYEQSACVIIADVMVPDTEDDVTHSKLRALIERAGCPVIIHAGNEYAAGTFPGAFGVIRKHESPVALVAMVEAAVKKSRAGNAV